MNIMSTKYEDLWEIVKSQLSCSAHNIDHIERVCKSCVDIAKSEKDVNMEVLMPAAILHDIARVMEDEDDTGEIDHAVKGAEMAGEILQSLGYDKDIIEKIKNCIKMHRFRTGMEPNTIEAKILFDADKIDVLGAVGISRCYMYSGAHKQRLTKFKSLEEYKKENIAENGRIKNPSLHSPYIEYEMKMKNLHQKLYTETARKIAVKRVEFMDTFFKELEEELN